MRKHHVLAVVAVLLIGVVAKQFFLQPKVADADTRAGNMDIRQTHIDHPNLRAQKMHDMTFVFDSE
jgi:hypothetical protein